MTRQVTFRRADVERALAVAEKRGLPICGYEIAPDGTIRVLTQPPAQTKAQGSELERWRQKRGRSAA